MKTVPLPIVTDTLKVVSATFLLVCFVCLKGSTYEIWKNAFCFTSKALLVLGIITFRYSNIRHHQMPKHETRNTYIIE